MLSAGFYVMVRSLVLRDHWYHLFVGIYYHSFVFLQDGMLYKLDSFYFYKVQISVILTIFLLTFWRRYDMLVMLGCVYRFPLFLRRFWLDLFGFVEISQGKRVNSGRNWMFAFLTVKIRHGIMWAYE